MSDRETIVHAIRTAHSRIRRTQFMDRTVSVVLAFAAAGILVRLLHLFVRLDPRFMTYFWIAWVGGLAATIVLDRTARGSLDWARTASSLDRRARLNDEVLSAWWFLSQEVSGPWVDLHIRKAAEKARMLDVGRLFPIRVPSKVWFAVGGLGAMVVLQLVPLPFVPNLLLSTPPPADGTAPADRNADLDEIERLLREARELNPEANLAAGASIDEFERLVESMRDEGLSLADTEAQADAVDALVDEGNLNVNSLLEGLEQMGDDLRRAEETAPAGEALSRGDLDAAAREFEALAEELSSNPGSDALQEALDQAAENARAGLEDLSSALEQAAEAIRNQDAPAASEAMMEAAQSIDDLSDLVESQQLQNQAAQQMDELREAARQQENASGETPPSAGTSPESANAEPGEGEPSGDGGAAQRGQSGQGEGAMPPDALQSGAGQGESETASGEPNDGEVPEGAVPSMTGNTQGLDPSGTGQIPTGLGFSPDQKTGEATSLDVQLEVESTAAAAANETAPPEPQDVREEATRQERSRLDYRSVPTDLSPAQQELLNEERIPREYRNVIRDYFQAIRPRNGEERSAEPEE